MAVPQTSQAEKRDFSHPATLNIPKTEKTISHFSGFSIKQMHTSGKPEDTSAATMPETESIPLNDAQPAEINPTDLIVAWRTFAQNMPHEEKAMSQRMDQLEPKMISKDEFEVLVENPTVLDQMKGLMHRIIPSMRKQLSHPTLKMKVSMRELSDAPLVLSRQDQIKLMREHNNAFVRLEREFALTL